MNRHEKHLHTLAKIAWDVSPVNSARIAASIVLNNGVISFGTNSYKTHPMQRRFAKKVLQTETPKSSKVDKIGLTPPMEAICIHAEMLAISHAIKRIGIEDLKNSTLYVCRVKKNRISHNKFVDTWGIAKPCSACQSAINLFEIKKVYYSVEGIGNYQCY